MALPMQCKRLDLWSREPGDAARLQAKPLGSHGVTPEENRQFEGSRERRALIDRWHERKLESPGQRCPFPGLLTPEDHGWRPKQGSGVEADESRGSRGSAVEFSVPAPTPRAGLGFKICRRSCGGWRRLSCPDNLKISSLGMPIHVDWTSGPKPSGYRNINL